MRRNVRLAALVLSRDHRLDAIKILAGDPDHRDRDDQGEQRDPGGYLEPAGEPDGKRVIEDRRPRVLDLRS